MYTVLSAASIIDIVVKIASCDDGSEPSVFGAELRVNQGRFSCFVQGMVVSRQHRLWSIVTWNIVA